MCDMESRMNNKKPHSVPVPQLYKEASKILGQLERKEGSLKTLVYGGKYKNFKKIYALLSKAWSQRSEIQQVLAASKLFHDQPNFNPHLAHILTSELLNKGFLSGNCKPIQVLLEYEEKLKSLAAHHLTDVTPKQHNHENGLPRYVRVNTLVSSVEAVHAKLFNEGWRLTSYDRGHTTYDDFLYLVENLEEYCYLIDYHIQDLLVFPPSTPFWNSSLYKNSVIILQDKASCLPVFLSSVKAGSCVLDACAAPGNKTSQIAAAINDSGKIIASEKNFKRFKTLEKLLQQRGVTCARAINQDFTKLPFKLVARVKHIFVDPTCSSSGTDLHMDEIGRERLERLAAFQISLLLQALSHPTVQEVVYSTCSVHAEENEEVVWSVLRQHEEFELEDLGSKLKGWKNFGKEDYEFGKCCLRTVPDIDKCHGFFVAKFIRKELTSSSNSLWESKKNEEPREHEASDDMDYCVKKKKRKFKD
ncbi:28S rRNA (cytosine-C(5))-methyltransferase-like [Portunus trituberculatus]|uniref:28S rRNA (cytosine-C(5))-methyltransferase-like n=1 Tax=Portunus trituberculatus TaxID=210409 RepID=UPI001E1CF4FB|nr:28S rRNA (cytosine-C(5))-methyltransferase-like [Portunus trituberculatus]